MERKLIAMDLDGTTVDSHGKLGNETKKALKEAKDCGHFICFVSGRRDIDMISLITDCEDVDYLILNNGGKLICNKTARILDNEIMDYKETEKVIRFCLENQYQIHVLNGLEWYVNQWSQGLQDYAENLGCSPYFFCSLEELPLGQIEGLTATGDAKKICAFIKQKNLHFSVVASEPTCVDIMKEGVNKWKGIEKLLPIIRLKAEDVIAVGDYENDIEMIAHAGIGVAVANALDCVKMQADYVTYHDNNHNAIADIIRELVLKTQVGFVLKNKKTGR